ncbi:hypothetical protein Aperf_G00000102304 [Anoplocephala perfoliata]
MGERIKLNHSKLGEIEVLSDLYHIYLKPICKVHITVQISGLSSLGAQSKSLSTWEVSEKVRQLCPAQLSPTVSMKVTGVTVDFVRFLVELNSRSDVKRVIKAVDSQRIKLSGFPQTLRVRSGEAPIDCPRKHDWDAFFRDAKDMNELIPGERPDTVVISRLPVRWFSGSISKFQPDPKILEKVFQTFGKIRRTDVPILDPCQNHHLLAEMGLTLEDAKEILSSCGANDNLISTQANNHSGFGKITPAPVKQLFFGEETANSIDSAYPLMFTAYIQFADYAGFATAMETLRGKKLIYVPGDKESKDPSKFYSAEIKIDFDRTKHLSDISIRRRRAARIQLEDAAREKAEAAARAAEEAARREAELEAARLAEEERVRAELEAAAKRAAEEAKIRAVAKRLKREEKRRRAEEAKQRLKAQREAEEKKRILRKRLKREMAKFVAQENERKRYKHRRRHHCHHSHHERDEESDSSPETSGYKIRSVRTNSIAIQTSPKRQASPKRQSVQSDAVSMISDASLPRPEDNRPPFENISLSGNNRHSSSKPESNPTSSSNSRDRSPIDSDEERLRKRLIDKREAQLRAQILARLKG